MKRKKILLVVLSSLVAFVCKTTFAIRFSDGFCYPKQIEPRIFFLFIFGPNFVAIFDDFSKFCKTAKKKKIYFSSWVFIFVLTWWPFLIIFQNSPATFLACSSLKNHQKNGQKSKKYLGSFFGAPRIHHYTIGVGNVQRLMVENAQKMRHWLAH